MSLKWAIELVEFKIRREYTSGDAKWLLRLPFNAVVPTQKEVKGQARCDARIAKRDSSVYRDDVFRYLRNFANIYFQILLQTSA